MSPHRRRPARGAPLAALLAAVLLAPLLAVGLVAAIGARSPHALAAVPGGRLDQVTVTGSVPDVTSIPGFEDVCVPDPRLADDPTEPVPAGLTRALEWGLTDPRFADSAVSASIWIEGYGEVATRDPDTPLLPASNEKLLTAVGVYDVLPADHRFQTVVRADGPIAGGVLDGDLVLVGRGDPTLTRSGPHSLDVLALGVRARGITRVTGVLRYDESHFDGAREAEGWLDRHVPGNVGPQSALMVEGNRYRTDPAYEADPARGNAEEFARSLFRMGTVVAGGIEPGGASGAVVAETSSAPSRELVRTMLLESDNVLAEALWREVGAVARGDGSVAAATGAVETLLAEDCLDLEGTVGDGSGLSRTDRRSAREWRTLLGVIRDEPWWPELVAALPEGGRSGTLRARFHGTAAEGNVRAKTGTIQGGIALSGYLDTADDRAAVFSIVVNGPAAGSGISAVDDLVAAIAGSGAGPG